MYRISFLALLVGVASHISYFNRYECHRQILGVVGAFFVAITFSQWFLIRTFGIWLGSLINIQIALGYLFGVFGSTLIYRLFFNPLNRFPGPYSARLTDFWMSIHVGKHLDQYRRLDALHKKYGPYVRTGANQLSIVDPELIAPAYHGAQRSGVTKAGWYDFDWPARSLLSERTFHGHSRRRRLWAPAFSDKALHQYETKVTEFNDKFLDRISQLQSTQGSVNVSELFGLYSFDVMGSLVFGEDYKMLETNKKHHALELLTEGLSSLGLTLPIWFFILVKSIPWDLGGTGNFNAFCDAQVERTVQRRRFSIEAVRKFSINSIRRFSIIPQDLAAAKNLNALCGAHAEQTVQKKKFNAFCDAQVEQAVQRRRSVVAQKAHPSSEDQRSILYWVLKTYGDRPHLETDIFLRTDARLLIVAGSDTTAATLTYLFYHLAQRPADVEKIREEMNNCHQDGAEWSERDLRHCLHLNGAINEALRLHPPGPSGVHRTTPAEGLHVGEVLIPGGTNFNMPFYTLNHDESIYINADSFVPERWYSKPELVKDKKAFIPFLSGPYSCLGKNLALIELHTLTARVLMEYDVKLAQGEDGSRLLCDSKDHFTISLAPLDLEFTPIQTRQRSGIDARKMSFMGAVANRDHFSTWRGSRRDSCISRDIIPEEALENWHW